MVLIVSRRSQKQVPCERTDGNGYLGFTADPAFQARQWSMREMERSIRSSW